MGNFRETLYDLKKDFSRPGSLVKNTGQNVDFANGTKSLSEVHYPVCKIIVLPNNLASKLFGRSTLIDQNTRIFLIDSRDIPVEPKSEDYIILGLRYQVQTVSTFQDDCYVVLAKQADHLATNDIKNRSVTDCLYLS